MNAPTTAHTPSRQARNLRWLLSNLVDEVPGVRSVAVVSSDGLLLLSSEPGGPAGAAGPDGGPDREEDGGGERADGAAPRREPGGRPERGPRDSGADLATIVSGLGSLTQGASKLMDAGPVKQTMVAMDEGSLFVMSISDGSLLGVHAAPDCDMSVVAYHMALFVGRAGHVLTPELRTELRTSMELDQ
ncbi:roadblock/LC7 domain-containing protein [Streptomyces verrucosisporus]|uniref:roadblock/LC7 domain-containing protein n=1 Tax=Streptomyces verrucosisporus TaxID=1695161 RepID=UPI0019D1C70C|nr:roadblock/LC7 domain-containing protein [Streptomyces verrucosisporus]MBN3932158.1 roadblock/LC7 domain-containing protein [Streptomyces verrucosisporus]